MPSTALRQFNFRLLIIVLASNIQLDWAHTIFQTYENTHWAHVPWYWKATTIILFSFYHFQKQSVQILSSYNPIHLIRFVYFRRIRQIVEANSTKQQQQLDFSLDLLQLRFIYRSSDHTITNQKKNNNHFFRKIERKTNLTI